MKNKKFDIAVHVEDLLEQLSAEYTDSEELQRAIDTKVQMEQYNLIADLTSSIHSLLHLLQNSKVIHHIPVDEHPAYQAVLEEICSVAVRGQHSLQNVEALEDMAHLLFLPEAVATIQ